MQYVSTFISYSKNDKRIVHAVANELCQLGILVWLDENELEQSGSITRILRQAIQEQSTVSLFFSADSVDSRWVNEELKTALELEKAEKKEKILPIFLGDPMTLLNKHTVLKNKWINADGDCIDKSYIVPPKNKSISEKAKVIARKIALRIYSLLNISDRDEIILYFDQRGTGRRVGKPGTIPENVEETDAPILVFRQDHGERTPGSVLQGAEWEKFRDNIYWTLSEALKNVRWASTKTVRILGNSQLIIPFVLGQIYDRGSSANLYCYGKTGIFNNAQQPRISPLSGGDPNCELIDSNLGLNKIPAGQSLAKVSVLLAKEGVLKDTQRYLQTNPNSPPLVMVKSGDFNNNEDVMKYIIDVVALLLRLRNENGVKAIDLFCSLPFHAIPILAANLLYVVDNITFMEYDRSATQIEKMYIPLPTIARK